MVAHLGGVWEISGMTLEVVEQKWAEIGLQLNSQKFVSILTSRIPSCSHSGACEVDPLEATLLGSPVGDVSSISDILADKTDQLRRVGDTAATPLHS